MTDDRIAILVNIDSGGRRGAERLDAVLCARGIEARAVRVTAATLVPRIRAAAGHAEVLAIGGGDGTLRSAAEEVAGTDTLLVPVPLGTLNHFCLRLGIERLEDAVDALREGRPRDVAVGVVDDRFFLNTATFGFYASMLRRRERWRRFVGRWTAATLALACELVGLDDVEVELWLDGRAVRRRTPLVWVGLGRGSFPFVEEERERRTDPTPSLEIALLPAGGRSALVRVLARLAPRVARAGVSPIPGVELLHGRHLLLRCERPIGATLDGEVFELATPLFCSVHDGGLRVLVE